MVDSTTISTIATTGAAIATGLLALATFWLARSANKSLRDQKEQLRLVTYQASAMRAQLDPLLKLHRWAFKENKLTFEVENMGSGRAFWIGVDGWFYPSDLAVSAQKDGERLTRTEIQELTAKGTKMLWARPASLNDKQRFDFGTERDVVTASTVTFFFNERLAGESILDPQERRDLEIEVHFELKPRKSSVSRDVRWAGKYVDFKEARAFLQSNQVDYAAFGFRIVCRNAVADAVHGEAFGQLIMFVNEDASLEDVARRGFTHSMAALGERELPSMRFLDSEMYHEAKFVKSPPKGHPLEFRPSNLICAACLATATIPSALERGRERAFLKARDAAN